MRMQCAGGVPLTGIAPDQACMLMTFRSLYRISSFAAAFAASGVTTSAGMSALNEVRIACTDSDGQLQGSSGSR